MHQAVEAHPISLTDFYSLIQALGTTVGGDLNAKHPQWGTDLKHVVEKLNDIEQQLREDNDNEQKKKFQQSTLKSTNND